VEATIDNAESRRGSFYDRGFTENTVSTSDNDLHLVRVTSARLDGRMPDIPAVAICRTVSLWMFLLSLVFFSVYFFTSLDLGSV
jgi:hypothetical protein